MRSPQTTVAPPSTATPRTVVRLAAAADVDPRTAKKALQHGLTSVRGRAAARLAEAAPALGVQFPVSPDAA